MEFTPPLLPPDVILHNRGCGINYLQRRGKIPFGQVPEDSWFLREKLCDKIAVDISWSRLEPEEGRFLWDQPEWEGCFQSWIDAGYKILLKVRGMDTLGTFYDQGTPQWVFDAGAKYVDESIAAYRGSWLLNDIPADREQPIRYPVYWDPVYLEKTAALLEALGKRYNGRPEIESFAIAHTGRWGEMHIADHQPIEPWVRQGYSVDAFLEGHRRAIDLYRAAFPDTPLQQSIGSPSFHDRFEDAMPSFEYLAECGVMLKCGGLGKAWHPPFASPWLDDDVCNCLDRFRYQSKIVFENLAPPAALQLGLDLGMSYWQRGGEAEGLGILRVEEPIPIADKKIYSFCRFFPEEYAGLTIEDEKNLWRNLARQCGYRIALQSLSVSVAARRLQTRFLWANQGVAPCYETFRIRLSLAVPGGNEVWSFEQSPACGCSPRVWDARTQIDDLLDWQLPPGISLAGKELRIGIQHTRFNGEMMQLANQGRGADGMYSVGVLQ